MASPSASVAYSSAAAPSYADSPLANTAASRWYTHPSTDSDPSAHTYAYPTADPNSDAGTNADTDSAADPNADPKAEPDTHPSSNPDSPSKQSDSYAHAS